MDAIDFRERQYVSQHAADVLGLAVFSGGVETDVDENTVTVHFVREETGDAVFIRAAERVAVGRYQTQLSAQETSAPGPYTVVWVYSVGGVEQEYRTYVQVGEAAPAYDVLAPSMKELVDAVWLRFADLFDSPAGGPNLLTYFQTHFGRGRIAQLLRVAVGRLNTTAQPFQTYTIDGDGGATFPVDRWGALLEQTLYVETIKHLVRSYVEQPVAQIGGNISRLDRRDYMQRWQEMLSIEEPILKAQLETFKIGNMGLGRPAVLVSGGLYGRYAPTRVAGSVAARPRYWARHY